MDVLPQNFRTLWLCGLWTESRNFPLIIYKTFVLFLISHISLGQVLYVLITSKSVKELTSGLVFTVTFVTLCIKLLNFVLKVKDMKQLLNIFRQEICQPKLLEEEIIVNNYKAKNLRFFLVVTIISQSISLTYMCQSIFMEKMELPLRIYDPFDITDVRILKICYALQVIECSYSVCLHMCLDTMIFGFINLTCGLFDVLCLRLRCIREKKNSSTGAFKNCFKLHIVILQILKSINSFFMGAIAIMFVLILLVICCGIFQITEVKTHLSCLE